MFPNRQILSPNIFYKHYTLTKYNVDAIVNHYVYASHPKELNDFADCNPMMLNYDCEVFNNEILTEYGIMDTQSQEEKKSIVSTLLYLKQFSEFGLLSLSPTPNNLLMWTHYSGKEGFCVEFDVEKFYFEKYGPFPINYVESIRTLSINRDSFSDSMYAYTLIKHTRWRYENEWRMIIKSEEGLRMKVPGYKITETDYDIERKFQYPIVAVKRIILANDFFKNVCSQDDVSDGLFYVNFNYVQNTLNTIVNVNNCKLKAMLCDHIVRYNIPTGIITTGQLNEYNIRSVVIKGHNGRYKVEYGEVNETMKDDMWCIIK